MAWKPIVGERVSTPYGKSGVVRKIALDKAHVQIPDLNNLVLEIRVRELGSLETTEYNREDAPEPIQEHSRPSRIDIPRTVEDVDHVNDVPDGEVSVKQLERQRKTCSLEALRFGLVPSFSLEELTVGYKRLSQWIGNQLPHNNSGSAIVAEIAGAFGTGKSHAMAVIRHIAEKNNYLTTRVEVDGNNISLSDPANLLFELWRQLRIPGRHPSTTPLLDVYEAALEVGLPPPSVVPGHTYDYHVLDRTKDNYRAVRAIRDANLLDEFHLEVNAVISGSREVLASELQRQIAPRIYNNWDFNLRPIIGRPVVDRPADFLHCLLGTAAIADNAGLRGLVITIDEFEVEHNLTPDKWEIQIVGLDPVVPSLMAYARYPIESVLQHGASSKGSSMEMGNKSASQWLVFTLANQKYAIHVDYVRELTPARIHQIRGLPQTKDCDVGALSLRGNIIAIRDLRTMIGLPSLEKETAEIIKLLETREQDHVNWIDELTRSVNEGRRFTLARDPHLCAFGKWYDGIMADEQQLNRLTNANLTLHLLIGQLETPHTAIHAIADAVSDLVQEGDTSGAHDLIESVRHHTLNTMVSLLRQIRDLLHTLRKPLIVVVECSGNQLGIQVDSVDCVVRISSDQIQPIPDRLAQSGVFSGVSEIKDEDGLLVMIDGQRLFTGSLASRCMASNPLVGMTG